MTRNETDRLSSSLACLSHPLTLIAIGTLLLNDHVLKIYYPSQLTGKLSDFAGLFFFPFLLSILLSISLTWTRLTSRAITLIAYGLTLFGFTSIKLFPAVNTLVEVGLSTLTSQSHQLVQDPTDLIALIILVPSWRLWVLQRNKPISLRPAWQLICLLGLATYGTLATSCGIPAETSRLILHEGIIYSNLPGTVERAELTPEGEDQTSSWISAFAISEDGGHTWIWLPADQVPPKVQEDLYLDQALPLIVCDPHQPLECFQIDGTPVVQASVDGGKSWTASWRFPFWRYSFANRYANPPAIIQVCPSTEIDFSPKDLVLAQDPMGNRTVVGAMGSQGILLGSTNGTWKQHQQLDAQPIPVKARTLHEAYDLISLERTLALLAGLVIWWVFNTQGWKRITEITAHPISGPRILWWTFRSLAVSAILFALFFLRMDSSDSFPVWLPVVLLAIPILDYALIWRSILMRSPQSKRALLIPALALLLAGLLYGLTLGIFLLWAFGIIPIHTLALLLAGSASWFLIRRAANIMEQLATSSYPTEAS